jgi:hypothetical protein
MGISLNAQRNSRNDSVISVDDAVCEVRVMPSQEDLQIARHCRLLMSQLAGAQIA